MASDNDEDYLPPGWYERPSMHNTLCYWDGKDWTDQVAPAAPASSGPSVGRLAVSVALGIALVVVAIWMIAGFQSANDETDCAIENLERVSNGEAALDCD